MTQDALDLDQIEADPLREAYERTRTIKERMTFEQAMSIKRYETCLRCYAEAIAKERKCQQQ